MSVEYPQALSRGLVLVKWWLLALPHYLIVGVFAGGAWAGFNAANDDGAWTSGGGLIGLLVLIAGVVLLFTGRYPKAIFDFVMGMNRWVYRVAAYATLMTDAYPPFRLDMGGQEPTPDTATPDAVEPEAGSRALMTTATRDTSPPPRLRRVRDDPNATPDNPRPRTSVRLFPGWRWVTVAVAIPVAGFIGWKVGGRVDAVGAALVGGALTGAGIGAVQWSSADGALGRPGRGSRQRRRLRRRARGGRRARRLRHRPRLLALIGVVSGAALGAAQGSSSPTRAAASSRCREPSDAGALRARLVARTGIGVDDQFTVFGAAGAVLFMLLRGLVFARFARRPQAAREAKSVWPA